jgi:hypothetical protein
MRNKYPKIDTLNILVVAAAKDISFLLLKIHVGKKHWNGITQLLLSIWFDPFLNLELLIITYRSNTDDGTIYRGMIGFVTIDVRQ